MADIDDTGFILTTENEYFEQERALYLSIDPDWNIDPSTPDGLKIANDSEVFANLDEAVQNAYNSKDPSKAQGVDLNILMSLSGSERDLGSPSTVSLLIGGINGTLIEAGKTVKSSVDDTVWAIDSDVTIVGSSISATATAVVNGTTQADTSSIDIIVDTVAGWQTVTNTVVAQPGTDVETNGEARLRRAITVGRPGNNQIDSMLGEIGNVTGVGRFHIYENYTPYTDSNGIPSHSLAVIVQGGSDLDIATAMFIKKNPGAGLFGSGTPVTVYVTSTIHPTNTATMIFGRPTLSPMTVVVDIINDGSIPAGTESEIEDAIIAYADGTLIASTTGFNSTGFDIGEDVGVSRLYTPVNSVIGTLGASYINALTVNGSSSTVAIAFDALSEWTNANITVNLI